MRLRFPMVCMYVLKTANIDFVSTLRASFSTFFPFHRVRNCIVVGFSVFAKFHMHVVFVLGLNMCICARNIGEAIATARTAFYRHNDKYTNRLQRNFTIFQIKLPLHF